MSGHGGDIACTVPPPDLLTGPGGGMSPIWWACISKLHRRTGEGPGISTGDEVADRIAGDAGLQTNIDAEAATRAAADTAFAGQITAEASARSAADNALQTSISVEAAARAAADALLLPKAGVTNGSNAPAGQVGEVSQASVAAPGTTLITATSANVTSLALTPGDWTVTGHVVFAPGGTTTTSVCIGGLSTVSGTLQQGPATGTSTVMGPLNVIAGVAPAFDVGTIRVSVGVNTTIWLVANSSFAVSTMTAWGWINARRER